MCLAFVPDLEERERQAAETSRVGAGTEAHNAEAEFAKQLERLRRENARLLERERELFEQDRLATSSASKIRN